MINFIRAEYYGSSKKNKNEGDTESEDYVQAVEFILCSINKVEIPKKMLKFDYAEMKFKPNSALDMTINLNSPLDGFMFPSFTSQYVDVNKVVYYSSRAEQINKTFVKNVLGCIIKSSAAEEKKNFDAVIGAAVGGKIKPDVIQNIYEKINERLDEKGGEEELTLDANEITKVLDESGVKSVESIKNAFQEVCGEDYGFKARNVVPDFKSKSIKIENENTSITIRPQDLSSIKQVVNKKGRKCLLIELKETLSINGIKVV